MFNRIAPRYDRLNHILSMRIDVAWRQKMAMMLDRSRPLRVLDLATGTGDQILSLFANGVPLHDSVGMDMAERMLDIGRQKIQAAGHGDRVTMMLGDATAIPLEDAQFDAVTISFGIRNVGKVPQALREMLRVLRPGGTALILEFSLPINRTLRCIYLFYLRLVMPRLGAILSGDGQAYRYLDQTIETFAHGEEFCRLMRDAGFEQVGATRLCLGIASIYRGVRPPPPA